MERGTITKESVLADLVEWRAALNALYDDIERWAREKGIDEDCILRREIRQIPEGRMQLVGVSPESLHYLSLIPDKRKLSFVPTHRWVMGAEGRLNVVTSDRRQYALLRKRQPTGGAEWRIMPFGEEERNVLFNQKVFNKLLDSIQRWDGVVTAARGWAHA